MCCSGFLKIMMFIFNGALFLAGAAILGVGIWATVDSSSMLGVLSHIDNAPPELAQLANVGYLLIAVGAILAIMGFLGCCGAITENKCMLLTFFIIVLLIFIAEVAGAIVVLVFKPLAEEALSGLNKNFVEAIKKEYGENNDFTSVLNNTMIQLDCCGYNNYTDFEGSPFQTSFNLFPETCCDEITPCNLKEAEKQS
ncbi:tetraspanin 34 isoform X2 [Silurus meridionalis]|uniref:tetraspanin 34 isoform X2 n=1 Tax=Silurus meridionalis TaxID=175797 RepID=UPI001EECED2B|nr:tetraspanin 34 isoform X2 [Silurus meridionalis]